MTNTVTKILGDEYDERIRAALEETLKAMGGVSTDGLRGIAGSQEIEAFEVMIGGRPLVVESETYVGLSVSGDEDLVSLVASEVAHRLRQ